PWMFYFGAAFSHDFAPRVVRVAGPEVVRQVPEQAPPRGQLVGTVTDAETHQPVAGAIVDLVGHPDLGLVATDAQGRYRTPPVPPGSYDVHARANDYNDNTCRGAVPQPQGTSRVAPDTTVDCALRPVPRQGNIAGRVTNAQTHAGVGGLTVTLNPGQGIT